MHPQSQAADQLCKLGMFTVQCVFWFPPRGFPAYLLALWQMSTSSQVLYGTMGEHRGPCGKQRLWNWVKSACSYLQLWT